MPTLDEEIAQSLQRNLASGEPQAGPLRRLADLQQLVALRLERLRVTGQL